MRAHDYCFDGAEMAAIMLPQRMTELDAGPACPLCDSIGVSPLPHQSALSDSSVTRSTVNTLRANAHITRAGEVQHQIHTLHRGWAMQVAHLSDGRRQILNFYIPGDTFAIEALLIGEHPANFAVRALTEVDVCAFPSATIRELIASSPEHKARYHRDAHHHLARLGRRVADIGQRNAQGRLAQLLLELWERLGERGLTSGDILETPVRQEHFADALGMTPVHVNRTFRALRSSGVIGFDRRAMRILYAARLRAIADEH